MNEEIAAMHSATRKINCDWEQPCRHAKGNPKEPRKTMIEIKNRFCSLLHVHNSEELSGETDQNEVIRINERLNSEVKPIIEKHQVKILADSHGKELSSTFVALHPEFSVEGLVRPGAPIKVVRNYDMISAKLTSKDHVVIIGGRNDVARNNAVNVKKTLLKCLQNLGHTNVSLVNVPKRCDLDANSCVSKAVKQCNETIQRIASAFKNVDLVDISDLNCGLHTHHGLHLNWKGKNHLANEIVKTIKKKNTSHVIPLPFGIRGEAVDQAEEEKEETATQPSAPAETSTDAAFLG